MFYNIWMQYLAMFSRNKGGDGKGVHLAWTLDSDVNKYGRGLGVIKVYMISASF